MSKSKFRGGLSSIFNSPSPSVPLSLSLCLSPSNNRPKMLVVLSPAKTLTIDSISTKAAKASPRFAAQADALVAAALSKLSPSALAKLCEVSPALGQLNHARFQAWNSANNPRAAAALAFDGPAFKALGARSMDPRLLASADERVRCLSGLYGVLKPTDAIQPYRLCMGTKIGQPTKDLYAFWGENVARALDADLDAQKERGGKSGIRVIVNAASQEYWKVVEGKLRRETRVVSVSFPGAPAVYAKQARGAVARFVAERALAAPEGLREFAGGGLEGSWRFDAAASSEDSFVFRRSAGKAAAPRTEKAKAGGGAAAEVKREEEGEAAAAAAAASSRAARGGGGSKRAAAAHAAPSSVAVKAEPAKRRRAAGTRK